MKRLYELILTVIQEETCHKRYVRLCDNEDYNPHWFPAEADKVHCDAPECFIEKNWQLKERNIDSKRENALIVIDVKKMRDDNVWISSLILDLAC